LKKFLNIQTLLLLIFVFMSLYIIILPPVEEAVIYSVIDDGMYYPKIALNFVRTGLFTYDGITLTNGFHPLWQILLIPVFYLFSEPMAGLKASFIVIFFTLLISLFLFFKITKLLSLRIAGLLFSFYIIFANLRSFTLFYSMLESHLLLLVLLFYIYLSMKYGDKRFTQSAPSFMFGLLLSIAFISRIDTFLLIGTYFFYQLKSSIRAKYFTPFMYSMAGTTIFILPYLIVNLVSFGHLSTVSSWIKFTTPSLQTLKLPLNNFIGLLIPRISYVLGIPDNFIIFFIILIIAALAIIFFTRLKSAAHKKPANDSYELKQLFVICPEFFLFTLIHFLFVWIFAPYEAMFSVWYYVSQIIAIGLIAGILFSKINSKVFASSAILLIVSLIAIQIATKNSFLQKKRMSSTKIEIARYVKNNIHKDAVIGMYDSGITSFFSDRKFVALNGLIGDFEMAKLIRNNSLNKVVDKYSVQYFVWDIREDQLSSPYIDVFYLSGQKTLYHNFSEKEKHMGVFKLKNFSMEEWFKYRYGK